MESEQVFSLRKQGVIEGKPHAQKPRFLDHMRGKEGYIVIRTPAARYQRERGLYASDVDAEKPPFLRWRPSIQSFI